MNKRKYTRDELTIDMMLVGGFLHIAFEGTSMIYASPNTNMELTSTRECKGYYVYNREGIASMDTLFALLWKEYTLSDSRYLTSDIFTVCVETITVVSPPLSCLGLTPRLPFLHI